MCWVDIGVPSEYADDVEEGHKEEGYEPVDCPLLGLFGGSAAEFDGCEGVVEGHAVDDEGGEGTSQHYYYKWNNEDRNKWSIY